ncbi:MAG: hypothetical protein HYW00_00300 [Candidatus Colwellbacteria bacterium]|nr:hypothetical protein [Candidatus Colwellbacteria bacterium]
MITPVTWWQQPRVRVGHLEDDSAFARKVEELLQDGWEVESHLAAYTNEHGRARVVWGYVANKVANKMETVEADPHG